MHNRATPWLLVVFWPLTALVLFCDSRALAGDGWDGQSHLLHENRREYQREPMAHEELTCFVHDVRLIGNRTLKRVSPGCDSNSISPP